MLRIKLVFVKIKQFLLVQNAHTLFFSWLTKQYLTAKIQYTMEKPGRYAEAMAGSRIDIYSVLALYLQQVKRHRSTTVVEVRSIVPIWHEAPRGSDT